MATLLNLRFGVLLITVHPSDPGHGAAAGGEAGARVKPVAADHS